MTKCATPFTCMNSVDLLNISTGEKAPSVELIYSREKGVELLREAEEQNSGKVTTYNIKTFATKHNNAQPRAKQINRLYKDESAVTRSLYFVHNLDDTAKVETPSHEWPPYPPPLFEPNKEMEKVYQIRSGNKADLIVSLKKTLGKKWAEEERLPDTSTDSVYIVDAMAFIEAPKFWMQHL